MTSPDNGTIPAWQTMETAPKDGTDILIVTENREIVLCYWNNAFNIWYCTDHRGYKNPSHWMPLPELPQIDKTEGQQ